MTLHARFPALSDLRDRARRRIPGFVWDYLDSATGTEATLRRNRAKLDEIRFRPSIMHGELAPDLSTTLFGKPHARPVGIAPVGMSGLIWPDAERMLARLAAEKGMPYTLSSVATRLPEDVGPLAGEHAWFQLYPPRDPAIRDDMLARVRAAGFGTLVLTADVPAPSRRERQTRGGLTQPPRLNPRLLAQVARCPAWAQGTARLGMPRMRFIESYAGDAIKRLSLPSTAHIGYLLRTSPDWDYLRALRDAWDGPLIVKGVLNGADAARLAEAGVDALWVSNHAGRQFDAAPASIEALPEVRAATTLPILFDSGVEGGLDVLRALALGADFVMLGRAFHYGLGAFGAPGAAHVLDILEKDMVANMHQIGAARLSDLPARLL